jgi:hypothetical protein
MENKEKILDLVQKSPLSTEDKKEWEDLASSAPEGFLEAFAVLLETFPNELSWFTDILRRKKEAFTVLKEDKNKGEKILQEIYDEEKTKIKELADKQE